jgi:hypothetical protein
MENDIIDSVDMYRDELGALQQRVSNIKLMLWAGDHVAARSELEEVSFEQGELVVKALDIREKIIITRNKLKPQIESRYADEGLKGRELEYAVQRELAMYSGPEREEEVPLFLISPVVSLLRKLDKRISAETQQPEILDKPKRQPRLIQDDIPSPMLKHELSGFRYSVSPEGPGRWEMRAYRLTPPDISPGVVFRYLEKLLKVSLETLEEITDRDLSWPLWGRAFLNDALVEVTVFDPGRVLVGLMAKRETDEMEIILKILDAIAMSEKTDTTI